MPDKAHKIRVQHLDRDMRGRSEWVPIGRAKVPWAMRDAYEATIAMWKAAEQHRPPTAHSEVALLLLGDYLDERIAEIYGNGNSGILEVHKVDELSEATGLSPDEIIGHDDSFEDESWFVPWPTTLRTLKALCARNPQPVVQLLGQRRAEEQSSAQKVAQRGEPAWVQDARDGDKFAMRLRQWNDLEVDSLKFLRSLAGDRTASLGEDFLELREMYLDFVRIAPDAATRIRMIPARISQNMAAELQRLADRPLPRSAEVLGVEPRGINDE